MKQNDIEKPPGFKFPWVLVESNPIVQTWKYVTEISYRCLHKMFECFVTLLNKANNGQLGVKYYLFSCYCRKIDRQLSYLTRFQDTSFARGRQQLLVITAFRDLSIRFFRGTMITGDYDFKYKNSFKTNNSAVLKANNHSGLLLKCFIWLRKLILTRSKNRLAKR